MDDIWAAGARYCARQDAHAFMWLWGLLLAFAGTALAIRSYGRRLAVALLLILATCTGAIGAVIFYACSASAPYTMGLSAPSSLSGARLATLTCLGYHAVGLAAMWSVFAVSCSAAVGAIALGRSRGTTGVLRACCYLAAGLLLLVACAACFGWFFSYSWCTSSRLF